MEPVRPFVLSIAGLDPSGGAGLLADIKTFEQHKVYGLGISTAQTVQTEDRFFSVRWEKEEDILYAIDKMLERYDVQAVKIGIVESLGRLAKIVSFIHEKKPSLKIIADTVIRTSSGYDFWNERVNEEMLLKMLPKVFLITPNYIEAVKLIMAPDAKIAAKELAEYCNVLLKGGHNRYEEGTDYLYIKNNGVVKFPPGQTDVRAKHGSGCVLSSAIAANLALGHDLPAACKKAKDYTEHFLISNETLLGYHHV